MSLAIKGMQIKTTLRFYLIQVRINDQFKNNHKLVQMWKWKMRKFYPYFVGVQTNVPTMENYIVFLKKLDLELLHDPAIPLTAYIHEDSIIL